MMKTNVANYNSLHGTLIIRAAKTVAASVTDLAPAVYCQSHKQQNAVYTLCMAIR